MATAPSVQRQRFKLVVTGLILKELSGVQLLALEEQRLSWVSSLLISTVSTAVSSTTQLLLSPHPPKPRKTLQSHFTEEDIRTVLTVGSKLIRS